jgi:zinc protease
MLKNYHGDTTIAKGEAFDASPANIDQLTQRIDLPSGLKLSLLPKKTRGGEVHAQLSFRFGDEHTLLGHRADAMATGAMLMRGSSLHNRQQIRDEFDRLKAQASVSGGLGGAYASIRTTRDNFRDVLTLVAEILKEPAFPESEFTQLKQQYLASFEAEKSQPAALGSLALARHMNPYAKEDIRYIETLDERIAETQAVTLDAVKAFYRDFYGASGGEITVIGDFDPEMVRQQLSTLFDGWKSAKPYTRIARKYIAVAPLAQTIETPDKANANWYAGLAVQMNDTNPDYAAMVLGNYILGSGMGSRLFARIRGKEGLSYGVGASFGAPVSDDDAAFRANAICAPQNAPKVEASFKDELTKILAEGYKPEEIEAAKKSWLLSRQVSRANDAELVSRLQSHRYWGRTMAYDADLEKKVAALTPAEVQAAMKKYLDVSKLSFVRAGDFKKASVTWNTPPAGE